MYYVNYIYVLCIRHIYILYYIDVLCRFPYYVYFVYTYIMYRFKLCIFICFIFFIFHLNIYFYIYICVLYYFLLYNTLSLYIYKYIYIHTSSCCVTAKASTRLWKRHRNNSFSSSYFTVTSAATLQDPNGQSHGTGASSSVLSWRVGLLVHR